MAEQQGTTSASERLDELKRKIGGMDSESKMVILSKSIRMMYENLKKKEEEKKSLVERVSELQDSNNQVDCELQALKSSLKRMFVLIKKFEQYFEKVRSFIFICLHINILVE